MEEPRCDGRLHPDPNPLVTPVAQIARKERRESMHLLVDEEDGATEHRCLRGQPLKVSPWSPPAAVSQRVAHAIPSRRGGSTGKRDNVRTRALIEAESAYTALVVDDPAARSPCCMPAEEACGDNADHKRGEKPQRSLLESSGHHASARCARSTYGLTGSSRWSKGSASPSQAMRPRTLSRDASDPSHGRCRGRQDDGAAGARRAARGAGRALCPR